MEMLLIVQRVKKLFSPLQRYKRNSVQFLVGGAGGGISSDLLESDDLLSKISVFKSEVRSSP